MKKLCRIYEWHIRGWLTSMLWWIEKNIWRIPDSSIPDILSVKDIPEYIKQIKWRMEWWLLGAIKSPQAVWKSKRAICSGYAMLAYALLEELQNRTGVLITLYGWPLQRSHTICVYNMDHGCDSPLGVVSDGSVLVYEGNTVSYASIVRDIMNLIGMQRCYLAVEADIIRGKYGVIREINLSE